MRRHRPRIGGPDRTAAAPGWQRRTLASPLPGVWRAGTIRPKSPSGSMGGKTMREIGHFIAGQPGAGISGKFGDVFNPASGEISARVALADTSEVNKAVAAAAAAWPAWAAPPPPPR